MCLKSGWGRGEFCTFRPHSVVLHGLDHPLQVENDHLRDVPGLRTRRMSDENPNWEDIARELGGERDQRKRKRLEYELGIALERAGFQQFSRTAQQTGNDNEDEYTEDAA